MIANQIIKLIEREKSQSSNIINIMFKKLTKVIKKTEEGKFAGKGNSY